MRIQGPVGLGHDAVLNRGNTVDLVRHPAHRGRQRHHRQPDADRRQTGLAALSGADSDNLTFTNNDVFGNAYGVFIDRATMASTVRFNRAFNNTNTGLYVHGTRR